MLDAHFRFGTLAERTSKQPDSPGTQQQLGGDSVIRAGDGASSGAPQAERSAYEDYILYQCCLRVLLPLRLQLYIEIVFYLPMGRSSALSCGSPRCTRQHCSACLGVEKKRGRGRAPSIYRRGELLDLGVVDTRRNQRLVTATLRTQPILHR